VDSVHVVFSVSLKIRIRTEGAWEGCPSQYKLDKLRFKSAIGTLLLIKDVHVEIRFIT